MGIDHGGVRSWTSTCDVCGERYKHTNWMVRWVTADGKVLTWRDRKHAARRTDTHVLACERKARES